MIRPECREVEVLVAINWRLANPSGPSSLYHDKSMRWEAVFCPQASMFVVARRCVSGLK